MPVMSPKPIPVQVDIPAFEDAALPVVNQIRTAVQGLMGALPESIRRAVDLERALKLDKKLAWQLFRLSRSGGLGEIVNVPSLQSISRVAEAARKRGVAENTIHALTEAVERFESFAIERCGDRLGLESMVRGLSHEKNSSFELRTRKTLFRAQSHVWGIQANLQVRTMIHTGERGVSGPGGERTTLLAADIGLQKLHYARPLTVTFGFKFESEASSIRNATRGEVPASPGPEDLNLLTEFCTQPLPRMIPQPTVDGRVEMEMVFPSTGRAGATTLYMLHDALRGEWDAESSITTRMFMCLPTEAAVVDVLIPHGWTDPTTARAMLYGRRHHPERVTEERVIDLLPQRESLDHLGVMEIPPPIAGAPRHGEAVRQIIERIGASGTRFDVLRCRIEYPVLHSLLVLRVEQARN